MNNKHEESRNFVKFLPGGQFDLNIKRNRPYERNLSINLAFSMSAGLKDLISCRRQLR